MVLDNAEARARRDKTAPKYPSWYTDAPDLRTEDDWYLEAFQRLSTGRPQGSGPIAWRSMVEYAAWMGLDRGNTDALVVILEQMDAAWMEHHRKQNEPSKAGKPAPKIPRPPKRPTRRR
ncbi:MAG: hypothetical protein OXE76_03975 [Alphaproteobacteria bacterium]|nr:hypothetical protein [Alphaproteobacteria bacterium]